MSDFTTRTESPLTGVRAADGIPSSLDDRASSCSRPETLTAAMHDGEPVGHRVGSVVPAAHRDSGRLADRTRRDPGLDEDRRIAHRFIEKCPAGGGTDTPQVFKVVTATMGHVYVTRTFQATEQVFTDRRFSRSASYFSRASRLNAHVTDRSVTALEGPEHDCVRKILAPLFSPRALAELRPALKEILENLVTAMEASGRPADLVTHIAKPFPVLAVAKLIELPDPDVAALSRWSEAIMAIEGTPDKEAMEAQAGLGRIATALIRGARIARTVHGRTTFVGHLVDSFGSGRTGRQHIIDLVGDVIVGAGENAAVSIGTMLVGLLEQGGLKPLREDPEMIPNAVEELLRVYPPGNMGLLRTAVEDVEIGGQVIPAGSSVIPMLGLANRDPEIFSEPNAVHISQKTQKHLTFGSGRHYCVGAQMARMEMQLVLEVLAERIPEMRLSMPREEFPIRGGHVVDGYSEIPVTW